MGCRRGSGVGEEAKGGAALVRTWLVALIVCFAGGGEAHGEGGVARTRAVRRAWVVLMAQGLATLLLPSHTVVASKAQPSHITSPSISAVAVQPVFLTAASPAAAPLHHHRSIHRSNPVFPASTPCSCADDAANRPEPVLILTVAALSK
ncbi:hypothetical protein M0R45_025886 [Rubus argutus]|uniref:Uncharacterized protein n=1 Tax=Rubus argutus TaxID=59490 RepID=A0AAW1WYB5_RUBAR